MVGAMLLGSQLLLCLGVSQCSASESRLLLCLGESVTAHDEHVNSQDRSLMFLYARCTPLNRRFFSVSD